MGPREGLNSGMKLGSNSERKSSDLANSDAIVKAGLKELQSRNERISERLSNAVPSAKRWENLQTNLRRRQQCKKKCNKFMNENHRSCNFFEPTPEKF